MVCQIFSILCYRFILKLAVADKLEAAENYGRQEGLREGKEEGLREGKEEGWRAGQKDTILGLVRDGFITPAAGAARLDMDEAAFQEAYNTAYPAACAE